MVLLTPKRLTGIYIFIIGLGLLFKAILPEINFIIIVLILLFIFSINLIFLSVKKEKSKRLIIPGITLLLLSIFLSIYLLFLYKYIDFLRIWPVIVLFPSLALIIYYLISATKSPGIIIPGIFIGIFSIVILIKNMSFLKIDFLDFILILISSMLIVIGLILIFQKKIIAVKRQLKSKK